MRSIKLYGKFMVARDKMFKSVQRHAIGHDNNRQCDICIAYAEYMRDINKLREKVYGMILMGAPDE